jgi:uncharacterized protein
MTAAELGSLAQLNRFPVKSMQGERLSTLTLGPAGVQGDRAFALTETSTGKVLSGKHPRLGTQLLACRASFGAAPGADEPPGPLHITLPDGTTLSSEDPGTDEVLSRYLGMAVSLRASALDGYAMDVYHPDIEGLGPDEPRDQVTESEGGAAVFSRLGITSPIPPGSFLDAFPLSLITSSTLAHLQGLAPASRFDPRRFRMNLVVETPGEGFIEQDWLGKTIVIGSARILVVIPDPRCVMTTLAQEGLPRDNGVLGALARHNRVEVGGKPSPCAGVYAVVVEPGNLAEGDRVLLA